MADAVTTPDEKQRAPVGDPGEAVLLKIAGTPFLFPRRIEERVAQVMQGKYDFGRVPDCERVRRILDVGAGVGEFACWAWVRWRGSVWIECYEADEELQPFLKHNLTPGGVVHPVAIKSSEAASKLPACDVLKLETGGHEVEILRGYAHRPSVVCVEWHGEENRLEVEKLLTSWGMRCFRLLLRHPGYGHGIWARSKAIWSDEQKGFVLP